MAAKKKAKNKKKKKFHLSKLIIPFVIISLFSFTGLAIYLQFVTSVELSSTLITCFFAFCTGELWMLASIKKSKIKHNFVDDPTTPEDESQIYSEIYNRGIEDTLAKFKETIFNNNEDGGNGLG
jgi:Na+/H+ antiporter NhaA